MRCAIYIRVSGKQQVKDVSLEDQLRACREYALRQGWTIIEPLYVEPGRSAFTENLAKRVAFQQLLADARRKLFDVVLVYKLDRFARKVLIQYQLSPSWSAAVCRSPAPPSQSIARLPLGA
ncbi:MAG TPA: recombinase family protein [Roseiflexaceae bacterium]|nr:recombinase family protein [Roseiflexaceae bacterium]